MRSFILLLIFVFVASLTQSARAQDAVKGFSIETEPVAYILGGAGLTGSYQHGPWTYSLEAYGELSVPESQHGNDAFAVTLKGVILQVERFITGSRGFYIGPEFGIAWADITLQSTGESTTYLGYSLGLRGGYHWDTGVGNLYLSPVVGIGYTLNARNIEISDRSFGRSPIMPWGTVGIGWSF